MEKQATSAHAGLPLSDTRELLRRVQRAEQKFNCRLGSGDERPPALGADQRVHNTHAVCPRYYLRLASFFFS